jgi:hypothetical protein
MRRFYQDAISGEWFHFIRESSKAFPESIADDILIYAPSLGVQPRNLRIVESEDDPRLGQVMKPEPPENPSVSFDDDEPAFTSAEIARLRELLAG